MFAYADIPYEDIRITREQWPEMKKTTPFGQLPMLEVDGTKLSQSRAFEKLVAKRAGLCGKTEMDEAKALMYVLCMEDMMTPVITICFRTEDEAKKAELKKKYEEDQFPVFVSHFEKFIGKAGFLVGNQISWPDIALFSELTKFKGFGFDVSFDKYPNIKKLMANVESNPKIKSWIEKRPVTDF